MFTATVFKILTSECRLGLSTRQQDMENKMVKYSVKKQINILHLLKLIEM